MTTTAEHLREHAEMFTNQARFSRVRFAVHAGPPETIVLEGYVAGVGDFHALKIEWEATLPPCVSSVFVHIDPQR